MTMKVLLQNPCEHGEVSRHTIDEMDWNLRWCDGGTEVVIEKPDLTPYCVKHEDHWSWKFDMCYFAEERGYRGECVEGYSLTFPKGDLNLLEEE